MSGGYRWQDGRFVPLPFEFLNLAPAGAASSTAADMALFMLDMLSDESRLLSGDTKELMQRQAFLHDPRLVNGMALGFYETTEQGIRIIGHGGDTLLFHSRLALFPAYDLGICISTNSEGGSEVGSEVVSSLLDHFVPMPVKDERQLPVSDDLQRDVSERNSGELSGGLNLSQMTGEYRMSRMSYTTPEKFYQMLAGITLSAGGDGSLVLNGYKGAERYLPLGEGVFQKYLDDERILVTTEGDQTRLYVDSVMVFYRVPWYGTTALMFMLTAGLLVFCGLAGACAAWSEAVPGVAEKGWCGSSVPGQSYAAGGGIQQCECADHE